MNRCVIVAAIGAAWVVVALAVCLWAVPSDPSGFYLVDHGRAEHHAGRLAAVGDLVLLAALLAGAALVVLARLRRSPVRAVLGAAPLLLMAGLLPLVVTLTSRYPGNAWLSGLLLGTIALGVLAPVVGPAAHRLRRTHRSRR